MKTPSELDGAFMARPENASKYTVGTVAVVGGCAHFPHAPVMAALGARAAGAGLVHLVVPAESRACAGALVPEVTLADIASAERLPRADAVVVGPGLGRSLSAVSFVRNILSKAAGRIVVDADALWMLAELAGELAAPPAGQERVLTPHEGEAARLLGASPADVAADRSAAVLEIARRYGATAVLKGPGTLVATPDGTRVYRNETGNPFMALGGMGDLLAGALAARWAARKGGAFEAAAAAVWLHGAAADALVARSAAPTVCAVADEMGAIRVSLERDAPQGRTA